MTRITLTTATDTMTLEGNRPWGMRDKRILMIRKDGIKGLYGTPLVRESATAHPQMSGSYWPSKLTQDARSISLDCYAKGLSSVETIQLIDRINALVGQDIAIVVEDAAGRRYLNGYLAADPEPLMGVRQDMFTFALVITCPDPYKYGDWVWAREAHGTVTLTNTGNAPTWSKVRVNDAMTHIAITYNNLTVEWTGDAPHGWSFDFRDALPSVGKLDQGQVFSIPPGSHTLQVDTDSRDVNIGIRPAWR